MIIGESDQRLNESNYYESPQKFEVLKRKFSSECENVHEMSTFSEQPVSSNFENKVNVEMHYIDNNVISEQYQTYQASEIHQDGEQSYINLTVLTPTLLPYDKNQTNHHQQMINFANNIQHEESNKPTVSSSTNKYEVKNYQQQNETDNIEDNEDKNLSWLFNFKLDDIANLSPEIKRKRTNNNQYQQQQASENHQQQTSFFNPNTTQKQQFDDSNHQRSSKDPCIEDDLNVAENIIISNAPTSYSFHTPKKPPFTYTELIEYALEDKGELTVSGIYQWISDRFPYYKSNDDRWKNSVRHNLSINPHFRKGNKAKAGAGHLWKISSRESEANFLAWEHKKQRLELFFKMEAANQLKRQEASQKSSIDMNLKAMNSPSYDAELSAATASIISLPVDTSSPIITTHCESDSPVNGQLYQFHEIHPVNNPNEDLRRTAGEILNGVRRNVEVQIMHPNELQSYSILNSEDYLNPISKEEIMQESGLGRRYDEFYLIDSGINMTTANGSEESTEVFEIFHEDFNLNYFGNNNIIA
ncbi:CLUMA_CG012021, isoform A [Clunio marinus]|uniref:CLUMA_CG012021, isoform A n=1 Tax=Clunio marinus TaxID=568069 RepID=A0A1J1IED4_9DIPT|nr:CLUMA_CG012021, isoform A [Clunio marinus]